MNSFKTRAIMGAGAAGLALVAVLSLCGLPLQAGIAGLAMVVAAIAPVASAAQSRRFDGESRLVYRPVYVRSGIVQRRVISDDE